MSDVRDMGSREPYRQFAQEYYMRGWIPLPLPPREKSPPPLNTTGHHPTPNKDQIEEWILSEPDGANIGLRVPDGIIGIDVDAYGGKKGGEGLRLLAEKYGEPLPPTWTLTARADGISGIRFYRVPTGKHWPGEIAPDIQIVQYRHRYAVAYPSVHPKTKRTYKWYPPGAPLDGRSWVLEIPDISGLAALTEEEVG